VGTSTSEAIAKGLVKDGDQKLNPERAPEMVQGGREKTTRRWKKTSLERGTQKAAERAGYTLAPKGGKVRYSVGLLPCEYTYLE